MTLTFPHFTLSYKPDTTYVCTTFADGTWSGGEANPDDAFHAKLLGITPGEHRFIHELSHHLVGRSLGYDWCPIVRASSLHEEMPWKAGILEWMITAFYYFALEKPMRDAGEWGAIMKLAESCNVYELKTLLLFLFNKGRVN